MPLTEAHKSSLRSEWRALIAAARALDVDALKLHAKLDRASPLESKAGQCLLFALNWLAFGYARAGTASERAQMGSALPVLAEDAAVLLDASDPAKPPDLPPPQLPFRRDLDG